MEIEATDGLDEFLVNVEDSDGAEFEDVDNCNSNEISNLLSPLAEFQNEQNSVSNGSFSLVPPLPEFKNTRKLVAKMFLLILFNYVLFCT